MYGLLVNMKPAWISPCLYMDTVGLLVLMPRYNTDELARDASF
jgi:hypothetical protein